MNKKKLLLTLCAVFIIGFVVLSVGYSDDGQSMSDAEFSSLTVKSKSELENILATVKKNIKDLLAKTGNNIQTDQKPELNRYRLYQEKVQEAINVFDGLNINNDAELEKAVGKIRNLMNDQNMPDDAKRVLGSWLDAFDQKQKEKKPESGNVNYGTPVDPDEALARAYALVDEVDALFEDPKWWDFPNASVPILLGYGNPAVSGRIKMPSGSRTDGVFPAYYTVKLWKNSQDSFWEIAGRSYVYNNPHMWRTLYQANKNDIPDPNNPDLIKPGMRMKIPSVSGEYRSGDYDPSASYPVFRN